MSESPPSSLGGRPKGLLHRLPLAGVAAAFVMGIVAGRYVPLGAGAFAAVGILALAGAAATIRRRHLWPITAGGLLLTIAAIGAVYLQLCYFTVDDDSILHAAGEQATLATLRGVAETSPQIHEQPANPSRGGYTPGPRTRFLLRSTAARTAAGWQRVSGLVQVRIEAADTRIAAGQTLELMGRISRYRQGGNNPGQYDPSERARQAGALVWMKVPGPDAVTILEGQEMNWFVRGLWRLRVLTRQHLLMSSDEPEANLLVALVQGERDPALRSLNTTMMRAGVAHYLSISGQHLAIFLGFIFLLCRLAMLNQRRSGIVVLAVLAAYLLAAQPQAPLLRSAIMAAALCVTLIGGRTYSPINALAAAAIILLAVEPLQLFTAGFQLSFVTVCGLLLLHRPLHEAMLSRWRKRRGLMVFRDSQRFRRWLHTAAIEWSAGIAAVGVAAFVVTSPLAAYHFGLFSPYAALLTLVLLPLMIAVLVPGYLSLATALLLPNVSHSLGRAAAWAAQGLSVAVDAASHLPGLCLELRPVPVWWVLLCYATIALFATRRRLKRGWTWCAAAIIALAGATLWTQRPAPPPERAQLHMLAVGNGQCCILRTPSGRTAVIDAGTGASFDAWEEVLKPFLRQQRLEDPVAVFISHGNTDHFNALPGLLERCRPTVYVNEFFGRPGADKPELDLMAQIARRGLTVVRLAAGDEAAIDGRTRVRVLWPPAGATGLSENDASLVLQVACDGASVVLAGDVGKAPQAALSHPPTRTEALVLPHHGAFTPALGKYIEAADPKIVLVSGAGLLGGASSSAASVKEFFGQLQRTRSCYDTPSRGYVKLELGGDAPASVQTQR
ncbi:MAG: ComEC/Rec2 family competence protein [Planctomycetaceae bacterium]|nr:ComEC/Rec2 family competence protein [Planctomycetaceae bacterium]